ncbi:MAG: hypothetical protein IH828_06355, partial [Nitrospinae bacterium]|nr:hypothetical protein [Nitrospinota bacterium]
MVRNNNARVWPRVLIAVAVLAVVLTPAPAHSGDRFVPQAILQAEGLVLT